MRRQFCISDRKKSNHHYQLARSFVSVFIFVRNFNGIAVTSFYKSIQSVKPINLVHIVILDGNSNQFPLSHERCVCSLYQVPVLRQETY